MTISTQRLRFLRGNSAAASAFTGLQGELIFDTTLYTLRLQDGLTPGGFALVTSSQLANVAANANYGNSNVGAYLTTYSGNLTAGNILSNNYLYANGVNILTGIQSNYGNANVAAYLVANPQPGTYSNTNVASYLVANPQSGTYSNTNVASYLVANPQSGTYSNTNVASYLVANPQSGTYSNSNVASYLPTYTGNIAGNIVKNSKTWTFATDGSTSFPGAITTSATSPVPTISGYAISASTVQTSGNATVAGTLDVDGESHFGGNVTVAGNLTFGGNGSINQITGNAGQFFGNTAGVGALYAGIPTGFANVVTAVIQATADLNDYSQINAQNINHGNVSSMEYVITGDLGTDTVDYIDLGFSSSNWDGSQSNSLGTAVKARDGYLYVQGGGGGGNLVIGTTTPDKTVKFVIGGPGAANIVTTISNTGIVATGNVTAGYFVGNGALLTGISAGSTYSNVNVAAYLPTYSGNLTAGNILSNNHLFANGVSITNDLYNKVYANANVAAYLASNAALPITTTSNVTGNYFIGNGALLTGIAAGSSNYGNANVAGFLGSYGSNTIVTTGNISGGFFIGNGALLTGIVASGANYSNTNVAAYLPIYGGPINANTITGTANATVNGLTVNTSGVFTTTLRASGGLQNTPIGNATPTTALFTTIGSSSNTTVAALTVNGTATIGSTLGVVGNITANYYSGNGSQLTGMYSNTSVATYLLGNIVVGNISGNDPNVTLVANTYSYVFSNVGNVSFPGNLTVVSNVSAGNITGNGSQLTGVANKTTGSWTLAAGANTVDFTVPVNGTYTIWVRGNIPNGIIAYTATVVVTNTNVPVIGSQYAWYYEAGNALVLTSIPSQIIGTVGAISNAAPSVGSTTNTFTFGITNNSGSSQVVDWGYTKLS